VVVFPVHNQLKAVIKLQPAMVVENLTDGCLPCKVGTAKNPQKCWRCKGTGAPPPELVPSPPGMPPPPPALSGYNEDDKMFENEGVPPRDVSIHASLCNAQFFNYTLISKDC